MAPGRAHETQAPAGRHLDRGARLQLQWEAVLPRDDLLRGGAVLPPTVRPGSARWGRGRRALRVAVPVVVVSVQQQQVWVDTRAERVRPLRCVPAQGIR